ncbi:MAG: hypothetical protein ABSE59_09435 [Opitutaceae bacterium]
MRRVLGQDNVFVGMTLHGHKGSCGLTTSELTERTFTAVNDALRANGEGAIDWGAFHLNIPHLSQHYYGNTAAKSQDGFGGEQHRAEVADALRSAAAKPKASGSPAMRAVERVYRAEALTYLSTGHTSIVCSALLSTAYLSEKGEVYPCTIWNKPLGNVRNSGYALMPIIEAARRDGVRRAVAEARCPNCWTPCEAYPSIAASPFKAALTFAAGRGQRPKIAGGDTPVHDPDNPPPGSPSATPSQPTESLPDQAPR